MIRQTKYLGVTLNVDKVETKRQAWIATKRVLPLLSKGLRVSDTRVREHLQVVLARSVMFYHAAPLVAASLWKEDDIQKMEATLYRKTYGICNQISSEVMLNVLQHKDTMWHLLSMFA